MKRKITALVLVVALIALLFTGMTLAYFTDIDSAVNVFTVGDVDIELDETVGVTDSNGNPAPDRVIETETGATYTNIMPGNKMDKKVTVTNLENPAYVRVVVIVNNHLEIWKALDCYPGTETDMTWEEKDENYTEVFTNWGITFENTEYCGGVIPETHLDGQGGVEVLGIDTAIVLPGDYYLFDSDNYFKSAAEENPSTPEMVQSHEGGHAAGVYAPHLNNYERVYVYYLAMDKGEEITLFDGLYCPTWFDQDQTEMFNGLNIEIYAAAIQKEGFATAKEAFEQLDKEYSISDMRILGDTYDGTPDTELAQDSEGNYLITSAEELYGFAQLVNTNASGMAGASYKLMTDIDLAGQEWTPVGQTGTSYGAVTYFQGNFDGNGYTIHNMTISKTNAGEHYAAGFFGFIDMADAVIENMSFDNANVTGHHWTGVVAGYITGEISGCTVTDSTVTCTHANSEACGDKAGIIVGYVNQGTVTGNTVENCTVSAGRDAGQVAGAAKTTQVYGNTIVNVTVTAAGGCTGANINEAEIGRVL